MAITSVGYAGSVNTTQWASLANDLGKPYGIVGESDFKPTVTSGDRSVAITGGVAYGSGIKDTKTTTDVVQLPAISSGIRYDMIVLRRNWATGATTLAVVQGTSTRALPGRTVGPGAIDDQPLCLVRLQAGMSAPQEIIDLRCWAGGGGGYVAKDELVLGYLTGIIGFQVRIGTNVYQIGFTPQGATNWIKVEDPAFPNSKALQYWGAPSAWSPAMVGSYANQGMKMQGGSQAPVTDPNGWARITFPEPFPNGLLTFQCMNGDGVIANMVFEMAGSPYDPYGPSQTKNDVVLRVWTAKTGEPWRGQRIRINWFAIGW